MAQRKKKASRKQAKTGGGTTPPRYIVLFHERGEASVQQNIKALERHAQCTVAHHHDFHYEVHGSAEGGVMSAEARLFPGIGAAAVDLTADALANLKKDRAVAAVVPNQKRYPIGGRGGRARPSTAATSEENSELCSYLRGHRDATESVYQAWCEQEQTSKSPTTGHRAPSVTAQEEHTPGLEFIGLDPQYQLATGRGVTVAVLDTGIDLNHADVQHRDANSLITASFVPGESVQDAHGHGTHVAGTIGGPDQPATGPRYGVAPDCNLMVGKVLSDEGYGYDHWILTGVAWAVNAGARIVSMSLGTARAKDENYATAYERLAQQLLDGNGGALLIAAAGNESARPQLVAAVGNPAACPSFMAIGAVDRKGDVAEFSCGQLDSIGLVDLVAPGTEVRSSIPGGYASWNGTSMAAPHVAGAAALYLEREPGLSIRELWWTLEQNAWPLDGPADYGRGLVRVPGRGL